MAVKVIRADPSQEWESIASFLDFVMHDLIEEYLSPGTIAAEAGMSRANFYFIKGGKNTSPGLETLVNLFRALNFSVFVPNTRLDYDMVLDGYDQKYFVILDLNAEARARSQRRIELGATVAVEGARIWGSTLARRGGVPVAAGVAGGLAGPLLPAAAAVAAGVLAYRTTRRPKEAGIELNEINPVGQPEIGPWQLVEQAANDLSDEELIDLLRTLQDLKDRRRAEG